jgi:hypothetical protein
MQACVVTIYNREKEPGFLSGFHRDLNEICALLGCIVGILDPSKWYRKVCAEDTELPPYAV